MCVFCLWQCLRIIFCNSFLSTLCWFCVIGHPPDTSSIWPLKLFCMAWPKLYSFINYNATSLIKPFQNSQLPPNGISLWNSSYVLPRTYWVSPGEFILQIQQVPNQTHHFSSPYFISIFHLYFHYWWLALLPPQVPKAGNWIYLWLFPYIQYPINHSLLFISSLCWFHSDLHHLSLKKLHKFILASPALDHNLPTNHSQQCY